MTNQSINQSLRDITKQKYLRIKELKDIKDIKEIKGSIQAAQKELVSIFFRSSITL